MGVGSVEEPGWSGACLLAAFATFASSRYFCCTTKSLKALDSFDIWTSTALTFS